MSAPATATGAHKLSAAQEKALLEIAQDRPSSAREVTLHALAAAGMVRYYHAPEGITPSGAAHAAHLLGVTLDTAPWARALVLRDSAWRERNEAWTLVRYVCQRLDDPGSLATVESRAAAYRTADAAWKATVQREDRERAAALGVLRAGGGAA
jgi:hypothetical protein